MEQREIKRIVTKLVRRYNTRNPFLLANMLNFVVFNVPLNDLQGCYLYLKKHRVIYINSNIEDETIRKIILAHEIGHALLHTKVNCCFMRKSTLLNTSKYEIEANRFAAELLVSDKIIKNNPGMTESQIAALASVTPDLLKYK